MSAPWQAELVMNPSRKSTISHVIFDFDGTLSWLRSGWPDVMSGLFMEFLPDKNKSSLDIRQTLRREILALNGKPSIHQMQRFSELAPQFDASPPDSESLLELYLGRLRTAVQHRTDLLARGVAPPENFVIAGAFALLDELRQRGKGLIILSGTAEPEVKREAALLRLQPYFGEHIYGSTPGESFSKKDVIDRIIHEEGIQGSHLLSFGDGPVEIEFTKAVGGAAIGLASDEQANGSGVIDIDKRAHLLRAGADAIIPDYRNTRWILETFFP